MEPCSSKLTLGYYTRGVNAGLNDLLGSDIQKLAAFLKDAGEASGAKISAFQSSHPQTGIGSYRAIRIRIEGHLPDIGNALDQIVECEGIPDFVDQPVPQLAYSSPVIYTMLQLFSVGNVGSLLVKFRGPSHASPTTPDAYDAAKEVYKKNKIRTTVLADDTLTLSSHGYI